MRINIEINDKLICRALRYTGLKSKRAAVEAGLELLVKLARQQEIRRARGKLRWESDLDALRRDA